jgi:translation elongation factor EF-1alpha
VITHSGFHQRKRGVTIAGATKEFSAEKWSCTVIDAPGYCDFIKDMITSASQADVALTMAPASEKLPRCDCELQPQGWRDSG